MNDCLLALDPSSTRVGYCVASLGVGRSAFGVREAGVLRPGKTRDLALERIRVLGGEVVKLLVEFLPAVILVEVSMTSHGRAGKAGARTLHVYGMAVGYVLALANRWAFDRSTLDAERPTPNVVTVEANEWTRGMKKARRTAAVAATVAGYRAGAGADGGGDAADAIGMARWWCARNFHHRDTEAHR